MYIYIYTYIFLYVYMYVYTYTFAHLYRRAPEELRVRGYQLVKYEQRLLDFSKPGTYVVEV